MSASSNAFKASRTEDNDNHAAVANIKGQYLLLYITKNELRPCVCTRAKCGRTLKQVAHAHMFNGPPQPIFGRQGHQSGSHISSVPLLPWLLSILQIQGKA